MRAVALHGEARAVLLILQGAITSDRTSRVVRVARMRQGEAEPRATLRNGKG